MNHDVRHFISSLGGYRDVAKRLEKKPTTVHTHMQAGTLPATWYDALCRLARERGLREPERALFNFLRLDGERQGVA